MPRTQGSDNAVRQGRGDLPHQVRRPPVDERLRQRLQSSFLLRDDRRREVHDLGPRPRPCEITAWHEKLGTQTASITVGANDKKTQDFKFAVPPSSDPENSRMSHPAAVAAPKPHTKPITRSSGSGEVRLFHRPQGHRHSVRHHRLLFLFFGFSLMMLMRWQLAYPGAPLPLIGTSSANRACRASMLPEFYNELGAMHGTIMVFLGVGPPRRRRDSGTSCCRSRLEPRTWRSRGSTC